SLASLLFAVPGDAASLVTVGYHYELIASLRQSFHTQDFYWRGRWRFFELRSTIVKHGANFSVYVAHYEVVPGAQRAVLNQDSGDWSTSSIQLGLEHHTISGTIG